MTDLFHLNPFQQLGRLEQSLDRLSEALCDARIRLKQEEDMWAANIYAELNRSEAIVVANFEQLEASLNQYKAALLGPILSKIIEEQDIAKELIPESPERIRKDNNAR